MRFLFFLFLFSVACSPSSPDNPRLVRGRAAYQANCTACHAADPGKEGPIGPAIQGSSRELIEARVLRASYPAGYTPKRDTKVMQAMLQLANDIDALAAFLSAP